MSLLILGVLIKVYWDVQGPWPVWDNAMVAGVRSWLEPVLLYSGGLLYIVGWVLNWD